MKGIELYKIIEDRLEQLLIKNGDIPTAVEISLDHYKNFIDFLEKNISIKGSTKQIGELYVSGKLLYIIPKEKCFEMKDIKGKQEMIILPFKLIYEGKQGYMTK